jgi:hypothetical protein
MLKSTDPRTDLEFPAGAKQEVPGETGILCLLLDVQGIAQTSLCNAYDLDSALIL